MVSPYGYLQIWDAETAAVIASAQLNTGSHATACLVTADHRYMVSASDVTLRVWDIETSTCVMIHRGRAWCTAVAASAGVLVAGDRDGTITVLDWPQR